MSRSTYACRACGAPLGHVRAASAILHLDPRSVLIVFVDLRSATTTLRCTSCGATRDFRGGRIRLDDERKSA